jgi:hypothetical protein
MERACEQLSVQGKKIVHQCTRHFVHGMARCTRWHRRPVAESRCRQAQEKGTRSVARRVRTEPSTSSVGSAGRSERCDYAKASSVYSSWTSV